ncbi:hypothetical protein [Hyphomonas neptunium]|uniref:hypothetical protein n=1 Tax=Hyphomonas hirschiana TaxID=81030 RepID=UPI0012EB4E6E|nr:hypothetical protein [Hyphomonas hirschiana]
MMGLMGSLSIIAMAWLNLASAEGRKALALSEQIATDYAIEGAFHTALADVINHRAGVGERRAAFRSDGKDGYVSISVAPLTDHIDINRTPLEDIKTRISEVVSQKDLAAEITQYIQHHKDTSEVPIGRIDDLGSGVTFEKALPCLREALTVFHNAAPPSRLNNDNDLRDGTLIRIRVATDGDSSRRGVEGTVLLTGNRSEPAWIMDWRRISDSEAEECPSDS